MDIILLDISTNGLSSLSRSNTLLSGNLLTVCSANTHMSRLLLEIVLLKCPVDMQQQHPSLRTVLAFISLGAVAGCLYSAQVWG